MGRQTVGEGGPSVSMQSLASVSPLLARLATLATLATLSSPLSTVTTEPPLQRDRGEVSSLHMTHGHKIQRTGVGVAHSAAN